jgi:hypothetical protein
MEQQGSVLFHQSHEQRRRLVSYVDTAKWGAHRH